MNSKITFSGSGRSNAVFSKIITHVVVPNLLADLEVDVSTEELKAYYEKLVKTLADISSPFKLEIPTETKNASAIPEMIARRLPGSHYFKLPENRDTEGFATSLVGFFRRLYEEDIKKAIREKNASLISGIFDEIPVAEIEAKIAERNTRGSNVDDLDVVNFLTTRQVAGIYKDAEKKAELFERYDEVYLIPREEYMKAITPKPAENFIHWHPSNEKWNVKPYEEKIAAKKSPVKKSPAKVVVATPIETPIETPVKTPAKVETPAEAPKVEKKKRVYRKNVKVVDDADKISATAPEPMKLDSVDIAIDMETS